MRYGTRQVYLEYFDIMHCDDCSIVTIKLGEGLVYSTAVPFLTVKAVENRDEYISRYYSNIFKKILSGTDYHFSKAGGFVEKV